MSTLKVDNIRHNSATSDAITTAADGTCTAKLTSVGGGQLSHRNIIINGGVTIHQRGGTHTHSGSSSNYYGPDRFMHNCTGNGKTSIQQSTDAPNGFTNSLLITTTTQAATASSDIAYVGQYIEANNITQLGWGASGATTATLSFYAKSSLTGNFAVWTIFRDSTASNHFTFTINNANTWERKTITIPALTSGGVASGSGRGVSVQFDTGTGSARNGTAGTWSLDTNNLTESGTVKLTANASATLQVTGLQLEVGDTATSFEHRSFGEELSRCQRYYVKYAGPRRYPFINGAGANTQGFLNFQYPVKMRAAPTVTFGAGVGIFTPQVSVSQTVTSAAAIGVDGFTTIKWVGQSNLGSHGDAKYGMILHDSTANSVIETSAEL